MTNIKDIDTLLLQALGAELQKTVAKKIAAQTKLLKSLPPEKIVEMVKNGSMIPQNQCLNGADNLSLRQSLFEAGWISAIVSFLNQGAHTEFKIDDMLKEHVSLIIGGGGKGEFQHVSPTLWLVALIHSTLQEFSLNKENCEKLCVEIAGGIGPLVACMCDDITREFFKSNAYYHESLGLFFDLIRRLAGYSSKAAEVLLEYDSLICLVVQCLFWRTHRPDIMEELTSHHTSSALEAIETAGRDVIDCFTLCSVKEVDGNCKVYDDRAKTYFKVMATTPIVSNAFDPDNDGIFLSNIASLMKADGFYNLETNDRDFYFDVLLHSSWAGCIDKNVISSVVDLFSSVRQCDVAVRVVDMTFNLLCKRTGEWIGDRGEKPVVTEDDERFAVAINAGMISACLTTLKRFDGQREYPELLDNMHNLLDSLHKVCKVARKKRSARAIESNRGLITEDLKTSEQYLTGFKETSILKLVKSTLFILDYCAQCAKVLEKKDVRRCSRCMVVKYCSRECQVEHWRNGSHKVFCNAAAVNAKQIKSDGGTEEDVRLQNSILHIEMSGDEIAHKHSASVVFQAISKGYDILDCIVDIDLRVSPPTIEVMLSEDFLSLDMNKESEMHAVKKMKVDEAREKKCLPFNYSGHEAGMVVLHAQPASSAFPGCVSIFGRSWPELQARVKKDVCKSDDIARMAGRIPGFMDKLEQIIVKCSVERIDSEDGPRDEEIASILEEMFLSEIQNNKEGQNEG